MAKLSSNVKTVFLKGLEALGKTASSLSDAATQKLNEMNLDNRRREVLAQIPKCVMQLWRDGTELPEPLTALLDELNELETKLAALHPKQETAPVEPTEETEQAESNVEQVESTVEVVVNADGEPAEEHAEEAVDEADVEATEAPAYDRPAEDDEDNGYNDVTEIADEQEAE